MKKVSLAVISLVCFASLAFTQQQPPKPPTSPGEVFDRNLKNLESEFVSAAEAMPEDKYDFAPSSGEFKGVRTFAQEIKHVAAVNYMVSAALLGEKPPIDLKGENGPDDIKSKDQIVKFIKDSFVYTHKAVQTVSAKNELEMIDGPFGNKSSHLSLALIPLWHTMDHYGQMVEYLRMNGIVPPASRQQ
jgi:hypothetical protein